MPTQLCAIAGTSLMYLLQYESLFVSFLFDDPPPTPANKREQLLG